MCAHVVYKHQVRAKHGMHTTGLHVPVIMVQHNMTRSFLHTAVPGMHMHTFVTTNNTFKPQEGTIGNIYFKNKTKTGLFLEKIK
jgi:hypothetical protein